jgi:hypothetical protein
MHPDMSPNEGLPIGQTAAEETLLANLEDRQGIGSYRNAIYDDLTILTKACA